MVCAIPLQRIYSKLHRLLSLRYIKWSDSATLRYQGGLICLSLEDFQLHVVMATSRTAIGANGPPLNVMGQVDLDVCLGNFWTVHTFIAIQDLTF